MENYHVPIMLKEVLEYLDVKKDGIYVDCTLGGGGHSQAILSKLKTGKLYAFDRDLDAIEYCKKKFENSKNIEIIHANFNDAKQKLQEKGVNKVDGILIDLGVSSHQIDEAERGFSFVHNGRLDMRMDKTQSLSAYEVVNTYSEEKLVNIFREYGEEEFAKPIAKNIIKSRSAKPIETTFELRDIIESSMPKKVVYSRGGASKKVFQAIRIEVNCELDNLKQSIENLISILNSGGRIAVLTFHSLEDRIVKNIFKDKAKDCICPPKTPICICNHRAEGKIITRKAVVASENEQKENSRSTCAKLRVLEKI